MGGHPMSEILTGAFRIQDRLSCNRHGAPLSTECKPSTADERLMEMRIMHQRLCGVSFLIMSSLVKLNQDPGLNKLLFSAFKKFQDLSVLGERKGSEGGEIKENGIFVNNARKAALIFARGGSKGIPGKNVIDLGGVPLIGHTIRAAYYAGIFDRIVVSTDCNQIAEAARSEGAEVPFLRPKEIAGDTAQIGDAVIHALSALSDAGYVPDIYAVLYPTSPFTSPGLIRDVVAQVCGNSCVSKTVKRISPQQKHIFQRQGKHRIRSIRHRNAPVPEWYRPIGLCEAYRYSHRMAGAPARRIISFKVVNDPVQLHDIDTPEDLEKARRIIAEGGFRCLPPIPGSERKVL